MKTNEIGAFSTALGATFALYDKEVTPEVALLWFEMLKEYELPAIHAALVRHGKDPMRGGYSPKPADVVRNLTGGVDAWLAPDEAWARAALAHDDRNTVVTCAEINDALASVRHLLDAGDAFNGSRAFKAAYERAVATARMTGAQPKWLISAGYDAEQRKQVMQKAVDDGLIALADGRAAVGLLAAPSPQPGDAEAVDNRARIADVLAILKKPKAVQRRDKSPDMVAADEEKARQQRDVDAFLKGERQ